MRDVGMFGYGRVHGVVSMMPARGNPFQRRRFASQTKPIEECHPERSEGSLSGERSFATLRMTKRDGLVFEMSCPQEASLLYTGGRRFTRPAHGSEREDNRV